MASGDELRVQIVPFGPSSRATRAAAAAALEHPAVRAELGDADARLLSAVPVAPRGDPRAEPDHVRATVYDYMNERAVIVEAPIEGATHVSVSSTVEQPLPSGEEFAAAVDAVESDEDLAAAIGDGRLVAYRPMPPIVVEELEDGRVERMIAVALRPAGGNAKGHEIVGVKAATGELRRFDGGAPAGAVARDEMCGMPDAGQQTAERGEPGAARITVTRGGELLWSFVAVRPAASSGTNGSGIELRAVAYKGKRVLRRAHVPILGDLWALRHRRSAQIDDGVGFTTDLDEARAQLDKFINGQSIYDTDVVLWYSAHFSHDIHAEQDADDEHGHIVGPDLVPGGW